MSQKHFIAIAAKIRTQVEMARKYQYAHPEAADAVGMAMRDLANNLADDFASFNGNFKRGLFLAACGF